jgi:1-aminocyclopropane-1-carboxylate deaminase
MFAAAVATVAAFQMVCFGKNDVPFRRKIIIFLIEFIGESHDANLGNLEGLTFERPTMFEPLRIPYSVTSDIILYQQFVVSMQVRQLGAEEPVTGGNKWYKLKYNLQKAHSLGADTIVTFGGAFSNHIAATARAGKAAGFKTIGIIRGEATSSNNITLARAANDGMQLLFVSREDYRRKNEPHFVENTIGKQSNIYIIPEGGSNEEGVKGCTEILQPGDEQYDIITVCCGTGATAAGIISSMQPHQHLIGFSVLKGASFLDVDIKNMLLSQDGLPRWDNQPRFSRRGLCENNSRTDRLLQVFSFTNQHTR